MTVGKIRVLVVDDSFFMRELIKKGLEEDNLIEVVGLASNAYEARDKIIELRPDVMTLDVEMPKLNGIEFLKKLIPQYPMPVVVVSSANEYVFDAMNAGATEFVGKFVTKDSDGIKLFMDELRRKVRIASISKVSTKRLRSKTKEKNNLKIKVRTKKEIIAIGASTGGTEAIQHVLMALPAKTPPILIVQHMPPVFTNLYAKRVNESCKIHVKEAENRERVMPNTAYIAPGGKHMELKSSHAGYYIGLREGEKVSGHCPSVDVLFESIAILIAKKSVGIILTGMGKDGAEGLLKMNENGALTFGQDEESCVVYGMPKVAFDIGAVDYKLPLNEISGKLISII
ncbi:MAG: chemotaxis response regulator protein-glutamate methylesterase [Acidaminobacteraceae bacterium]